jgi:hypothetical protein
MKTKAKYESITANMNDDGSIQIVAWYRENRQLRFDMIPLRGQKPGETVRLITGYTTEKAQA